MSPASLIKLGLLGFHLQPQCFSFPGSHTIVRTSWGGIWVESPEAAGCGMKSLGILVLPQSWDTALEWGSSFAAVEPVFCPVSSDPLFSNLLSIPSPITQTSRPYYLPSNSLVTSCPDSWALPTTRFPVLPFLICGKSCPDWFPFTLLCWVGPLASMAWRP